MVKCFICGEEVPPEEYPRHMDSHSLKGTAEFPSKMSEWCFWRGARFAQDLEKAIEGIRDIMSPDTELLHPELRSGFQAVTKDFLDDARKMLKDGCLPLTVQTTIDTLLSDVASSLKTDPAKAKIKMDKLMLKVWEKMGLPAMPSR